MRNKTVVITGASRGIGKAIALTFAKNNYNVVINYNTSYEKAKTVMDEVNLYSSGILIQADVSNEEEVFNMCKTIKQKFKTIDALVNNAGTIIRPGKWDIISDFDWDRTYQVNAKGTFNCIRAMRELFSDNTIGHIVNLASTVGEAGGAGVISYGAAKAAVINMTLAFAKEFAPNIVVNAVSPGNINTDMTMGADHQFIMQTIEKTPLKRLGEPQEVADMVYFLCTDHANFITGQVIDIDGGYSLK